MQYTVGSKLNTLYYDGQAEQYFEVTGRKDITNSDGKVIGQEASYTTYSSYNYYGDSGKYVGVNATGTHTAVRYEEEAQQYFRQLRGS